MTNDFDTFLGNLLLVKEELGEKAATLHFRVDNNQGDAPTVEISTKIANGKVERTVEIVHVA